MRSLLIVLCLLLPSIVSAQELQIYGATGYHSNFNQMPEDNGTIWFTTEQPLGTWYYVALYHRDADGVYRPYYQMPKRQAAEGLQLDALPWHTWRPNEIWFHGWPHSEVGYNIKVVLFTKNANGAYVSASIKKYYIDHAALMEF